jgi:hypothetical protein
VPLERDRAVGVLAGLVLFGLAFVVAALVAESSHGIGPAYWTAIGVGFTGIGMVAFFLRRGTVPLPPGPIWSRAGLAVLAESLGLPAVAVQAVVYGLIGAGVIGNILLPTTLR